MKKPEKKTNKEHTNLTKTFGGGKILTQKALGYNQAIDDYEKYHTQEIVSHMKAIGKLTEQLVNLPSEEEIEELILNTQGVCLLKNQVVANNNDLAKAISKRLRR